MYFAEKKILDQLIDLFKSSRDLYVFNIFRNYLAGRVCVGGNNAAGDREWCSECCEGDEERI